MLSLDTDTTTTSTTTSTTNTDSDSDSDSQPKSQSNSQPKLHPYIIEFNNNPAIPPSNKLMSNAYRCHLVELLGSLMRLGELELDVEQNSTDTSNNNTSNANNSNNNNNNNNNSTNNTNPISKCIRVW